MSTWDDIQDKILDLAAEADWDELVHRLEAYTRNLLENVNGRKPRPKIVDAYVRQAIEVLIEHGADYGTWRPWNTLFQLLCIIVGHHLSQYEQTVERIFAEKDWADETHRLLLFAFRQCGGRTTRHGRSAEDYVQEAIESLLSRRRYFPYDRVTLFQFLSGVIRSLIAHEAERMAAEGAHVAIVRKPLEEMAPTEWSEDRLVAPVAHDERTALLIARDFLQTLEDPGLRRYARLRALGARITASESAQILEVTEQTIRNWDRQLRRRRDRWSRGR